MKIKISNVEMAANLYWGKLSGVKPESELSALAKVESLSSGFVRKVVVEKSEPVYQASLSNYEEDKNLISAAAVLAEHLEIGVFIQELSVNEFWVCGVDNYEVIVTSDIICTSDKLLSSIAQLQSDIDSREITVYCSASIYENFLFENASINHEEQDFFSLIGLDPSADPAFNAKQIKSKYKQFTVKSFDVKNKKILLISAIGIAGIIGYQLFGDGFIPKKTVIEDPISSITPIQPQESIEDILKEAYLEEYRWLESEFYPVNTNNVLAVISNYYVSIPKRIDGWSLIDISYSKSVDKDALNLNWSNEGNSSPLFLRKSMSDGVSTSFTLDNKNANTVFKVSSLGNKQKVLELDLFISNHPYKHEELMHDLSLSNIDFSIQIIEPSARKEKILKMGNHPEANIPQIPMRKKSISIKGSGFSKFNTASSIMDLAKTFSVDKVTITNSENLNWVIEGTLYEGK